MPTFLATSACNRSLVDKYVYPNSVASCLQGVPRSCPCPPIAKITLGAKQASAARKTSSSVPAPPTTRTSLDCAYKSMTGIVCRANVLRRFVTAALVSSARLPPDKRERQTESGASMCNTNSHGPTSCSNCKACAIVRGYPSNKKFCLPLRSIARRMTFKVKSSGTN